MLVARFLDGLAGSAFLSVAGNTVEDMFNLHQHQAPILIYTTSPFVGPLLGPLVGGFINQYTSWRWTFYILIIWSAVNLGIIALLVPETYHLFYYRERLEGFEKRPEMHQWRRQANQYTKHNWLFLASAIPVIGLWAYVPGPLYLLSHFRWHFIPIFWSIPFRF